MNTADMIAELNAGAEFYYGATSAEELNGDDRFQLVYDVAGFYGWDKGAIDAALTYLRLMD